MYRYNRYLMDESCIFNKKITGDTFRETEPKIENQNFSTQAKM